MPHPPGVASGHSTIAFVEHLANGGAHVAAEGFDLSGIGARAQSALLYNLTPDSCAEPPGVRGFVK